MSFHNRGMFHHHQRYHVDEHHCRPTLVRLAGQQVEAVLAGLRKATPYFLDALEPAAGFLTVVLPAFWAVKICFAASSPGFIARGTSAADPSPMKRALRRG